MKNDKGFSLIELLLAMAITVGMGAVIFNLFLQNTNVFRDQNLILELQQSTRAVASMIADEIRMAGQGVPVYASSMDTALNDPSVQIFVAGTDADTIVFRSGIRNGLAVIDEGAFGSPPYEFTGTMILDVVDAGPIASLVTSSGTLLTDRFLFLWGATEHSWTWVRAEITAIDATLDTIAITVVDVAAGGDDFPSAPNISLEEAVAYELSGDTIQRATSTDFSDEDDPDLDWSAVGENFTQLDFVYYDASGTAVTVSDVDDRASIRRVDFTIAAQTSDALPSTGQVGTFEITMTVYPRNGLLQ